MKNVKVTGPVAQALVPLIVEAVRALFRRHPERRSHPDLQLTVEVDGKEVTVQGNYNKRDTLRRLDFAVTGVDGQRTEARPVIQRKGRGRERIAKKRSGVQVATGPGAIAALFKGDKSVKAPKEEAINAPQPSANGAHDGTKAAKKAAKAAKKAAKKSGNRK